MSRLALVKLAHQTFCRGLGILAAFTFCYTMRQAQLLSFSYFSNLRRRCKSKLKKERASKVTDAIYLTIPPDHRCFETKQIISHRLDYIRNNSATWSEIVKTIYQSTRGTTVSEAFYKLIRELAKTHNNQRHIIVIYALFVDVMTELDSADITAEVKNLQCYLLEFYGTLNPL